MDAPPGFLLCIYKLDEFIKWKNLVNFIKLDCDGGGTPDNIAQILARIDSNGLSGWDWYKYRVPVYKALKSAPVRS